MSERFQLIDEGIDVSAAIAQLDAKPHLWNHRGERRLGDGCPHSGSSDIWVRYRAPDELAGPQSFAEEHESVFWPAWYELTELHPIILGVMDKVHPTHLGGILITRIPPGGKILPHHDRGTWHAENYDCKVYVPLRANPLCINECGGEIMVIREGDAVRFDNLVEHSVSNGGKTERITLIICMKGAE